MTKKIYVNKNDEVTEVVEALIDADADEVILSIPKFSKLAESASHFHLLRREAEVLKKKIVVESVDEAVLSLCEAQRIECINPFFSKTPRRVTDIMPKATHTRDAAPEKRRAKIVKEVEEAPVSKAAPPLRGHAVLTHTRTARRFHFGKGRWWVSGVVAVLILGAVLGTMFRKAQILVTRATASWKYENEVTVDKTLTSIDLATSRVPGQVFSEKKNVTLAFPATGKKVLQRAAKGTIIVYNAHSTQSQALVARTRFVTPEGKVFRLAQGITVPGATMKDGALVPSSIEAAVTADQTGPSYNIGPVSRFTIPGFQGTPKFETFYAESKIAMTGGANGETAYPTEEDIKKAKEMSATTLENALQTLVTASTPSDLKLLEAAKVMRLVRQDVHPEVNDEGQFTVYVEGELSTVAFKEADVKTLLQEKMRAEVGSDFEVKSDTLTYREETATRKGDILTLPVSYESIVVRHVDVDALKEHIVGKKEADLKRLLFATPGLASAKVSLWPFWVRKVPAPSRTTIIIE